MTNRQLRQDFHDEEQVQLPQPNRKPKKPPEQPKKFVLFNSTMDYTIYVTVIILVIIGVVMVFSASHVTAERRAIFGNDPFHFLRRNALFAVMGFIVMNLMSKVSYELLRPFAKMSYLIVIGLLVALEIVGQAAGGAVRWIELPVIGRFQPSELAKPAIIVMMAYMIEKAPRALEKWSGFFIFSGVVLIMTALVARGGMSSAIIVATIGFGMIFIASPYLWRFIFAGAAGFGGLGMYLWWMSTRIADGAVEGGFRGARFLAWQDPFAFAQTTGFQIVQSLYAIGSGGWFGLGIGQSRQSTFVPEAHNDIIFAIIVEELGFIGAAVILFLFGIFIWRGIVVAINAPDTFGSLLACGIVFGIAFQALINVAVVTNSIPNTGVTLPFISYGGTSLVVSMALAGVLLNISKYSKVQ